MKGRPDWTDPPPCPDCGSTEDTTVVEDIGAMSGNTEFYEGSRIHCRWGCGCEYTALRDGTVIVDSHGDVPEDDRWSDR